MKRQVWLDFNGICSDGRVFTLPAYAEPGTDLTPGATVIVGDDDGNLCDAIVIAVEGYLELRVDLDTWREVTR